MAPEKNAGSLAAADALLRSQLRRVDEGVRQSGNGMLVYQGSILSESMGRPLPSRPLSARPTGPSAWVRPGLGDDSSPGIQRPISARNSRFPNGGAFTAIERKKLHTQALQRLQNDPEFEHHEHAITPNAFLGASRFRQLLPPSSRPESTSVAGAVAATFSSQSPVHVKSPAPRLAPWRGLQGGLELSLEPPPPPWPPPSMSHWGPKGGTTTMQSDFVDWQQVLRPSERGGRPVRARPAGLSLTRAYPNNVQARHKLFVGVAAEGVRAMHIDRTTETREAYGPKRLSPRPLPRPRPGAVMGAPVWYGIQKSDLCW
jgi:hypothetical protein